MIGYAPACANKSGAFLFKKIGYCIRYLVFGIKCQDSIKRKAYSMKRELRIMNYELWRDWHTFFNASTR